jgi:hypothetical protein
LNWVARRSLLAVSEKESLAVASYRLDADDSGLLLASLSFQVLDEVIQEGIVNLSKGGRIFPAM